MTKIEPRPNQLPINSSESPEISSTNKPKVDMDVNVQKNANSDQWEVPSAHGCPGCPHPAFGALAPEPPTTLINGRPATTMKDQNE
jgi:hypothetical protein